MDAFALHPLRSRSTGVEYLPGEKVEAPEEKLMAWAERGLVRIEDPSSASRLFSNGKPTGATTDDLPHIRAYAWSLANLKFGPILSLPTDFPKVARECRLSLREVRESFGKLLKEGDLKVEKNRRGDIWYLVPLRW